MGPAPGERRAEPRLSAPGGCNESKSDHLAAAEHVTRWAERLQVRGSDLDDVVRRALAVARVIYLRLRPGVRLWQTRDAFERADRDTLLSALVG